jgi:hypothetical protein
MAIINIKDISISHDMQIIDSSIVWSCIVLIKPKWINVILMWSSFSVALQVKGQIRV